MYITTFARTLGAGRLAAGSGPTPARTFVGPCESRDGACRRYENPTTNKTIVGLTESRPQSGLAHCVPGPAAEQEAGRRTFVVVPLTRELRDLTEPKLSRSSWFITWGRSPVPQSAVIVPG